MADTLAFREPNGYKALSFVLLIPLTVLLIGCIILRHFLQNLNTQWRCLLGRLEPFRGHVTQHLGGRLPLWISVPAAMTLYILDEVTQCINPNGLTGWCLSFGLISGLSVACGVFLGLAILLAQKLWSIIVLIFGIVFCIGDSHLPLFDHFSSGTGRTKEQGSKNKMEALNAEL